MKDIWILIIFIIAEFLAMVSSSYILLSGEGVEQSGDVSIAVYMLVAVVLFGAIAFILIKLGFLRFFDFLVSLSFLLILLLYLSIFFPLIISLLLTISLFILFKRHRQARAVISIIVMVGSAVIVGMVIEPKIILIFALILAIYDYISVFKTKHMVTIAEGVKNSALMVKHKESAIGGGDIIVPSAFVTSIIFKYSYLGVSDALLLSTIPAILSSLSLLLLLLFGEKKRYYPAIPPLACGMLIGYLIINII